MNDIVEARLYVWESKIAKADGIDNLTGETWVGKLVAYVLGEENIVRFSGDGKENILKQAKIWLDDARKHAKEDIVPGSYTMFKLIRTPGIISPDSDEDDSW